MKFTYPAIVRPREGGGYTVTFIDLADCRASGDTLDEALDAAIAAELSWITAELEEEDPQFPAASSRSSVSLADGEFIRDIGVIYHFQEGWSD